jgi:hypothetical protein
MSDQAPMGAAPPQCNRCHAPLLFVMTTPLVDEPGRVQIFECAACGRVEFYPEM